MMRRLAVPAAVVGAVLAFYIIAPDATPTEDSRGGAFGRDRDVAAASNEVWALGDTLRALQFALARTTAWETARAIAPDAAPTKVIIMPGLASVDAAVFEQAARAQLQALGATRVPIRIVLTLDPQLSSRYYRRAVIPQTGEQPCVVVVSISPRSRNADLTKDESLLGACGFYARFGYAGGGMKSWLVDTRGIAASIYTLVPEPRTPQARHKLAGSRIGEAPSHAACVAGVDDGCAQFVRDPLGIRGIRQIIPSDERTSAVFSTLNGANRFGPTLLLAELRAAVGDERFAQIWASNEDLAAAYKTATGEHIAVFARPILLRELMPHQPGPMRSGLSLLFGLSIGLTAAAVAIRRTGRKRSGA